MLLRRLEHVTKPATTPNRAPFKHRHWDCELNVDNWLHSQLSKRWPEMRPGNRDGMGAMPRVVDYDSLPQDQLSLMMLIVSVTAGKAPTP